MEGCGDIRLAGRPDEVMSTRQLSVPTGGWQFGHGVVVSTRMSCKWLAMRPECGSFPLAQGSNDFAMLLRPGRRAAGTLQGSNEFAMLLRPGCRAAEIKL